MHKHTIDTDWPCWVLRDGNPFCKCATEEEARQVCEAMNLFETTPGIIAKRLLWANEAEKVLRGYEAWEGAMILDQKAWRDGLAPLPTLTYPLWDTLLELQAERNKLLKAPITAAEEGK